MAVARVHREHAAVAIPALSVGTAGFLIVAVGAWAGIVAFVGPVFGYSADGTGSWHWNLAHALLFLAPGAGAVIAGMIVMIAAGQLGARGSLDFAGFLAATCGAWLLIGPVAWPVLEGASFFHPAATSLGTFEDWVGYSLGPGGLLLALGAFVMGRDRVAVNRVDTLTSEAAQPASVATAPVDSAPVATNVDNI
jgi:hypothetical protein